MSLPRLYDATSIADRLNVLAAIVKTRSRANLTDASQLLETIATRFFNALFGWDLINLNTEQANYPAADFGILAFDHPVDSSPFISRATLAASASSGVRSTSIVVPG